MRIITSKAAIRPVIGELTICYSKKGQTAFVQMLHDTLLDKKIRFPLLEFVALELYELIQPDEQIAVLDRIMSLKTIGGNVLAGIMLQKRLDKHFRESFQKAREYMKNGDAWYVCDIIGERVMGHALLTQPVKTIPVLKTLAKSKDLWAIRSVGVGAHYAIKKGLPEAYVKQVFEILLSLSGATEFHVKKGIGWAAKTTAKFHPGIIQQYQTILDQDNKIRPWFRTKIKIGLGRSDKYAHRYRG